MKLTARFVKRPTESHEKGICFAGGVRIVSLRIEVRR
jgi:hypothetical protein